MKKKKKELLTLKGKLNCPGSHEDVRSWTRSSWSADSVDSAFVEDSDVGKERGSDSDEWGGRWDEVVRAMSANELWFDLCGSGDAQDEPIKLSATKATITGVTLSIFLCTDTIILVLMFFLFLFVSFAPLLLKTTANEESVVERTKRHLRSHKRSHSTLITSSRNTHTHIKKVGDVVRLEVCSSPFFLSLRRRASLIFLLCVVWWFRIPGECDRKCCETGLPVAI